jgi:hypothetical protein
MTKEELKKEAEECMHNALYWLKLPISKENVEQGGSYILKLLEPREKRIAELEDKLANADYQLEGRDVKIKDLETQKEEIQNYFVESAGYGRDKVRNFMDIVNKALKQKGEQIAKLEVQIEKLIDFVLSKTECCDVCPITDTCINSEGTCPYAGILSKGEEAVTREWLMQKIAKEIKEK